MAPYYNSTITIIPFVLALLLLISTSSYSKRHPCLPEQQNALLQLNVHSVGRSWSNETDCCLWKGVTCNNETGDVISLDLGRRLELNPYSHGCSLITRCRRSTRELTDDRRGFFDSFTQFPKLLHLDISCNGFDGTIPANISHSMQKGTINNSSSSSPFQNLRSLNLSHNDLRGSLNFLGQFSNLKRLDLHSNGFSGIIPREIARLSHLISLDLSENNLTLTNSTLELLVQNLTQIQELNLEGVRMEGVSASSLLNLSSTTKSLTLRSCGLRGRFPDYIFQLPKLRVLDLSENPRLNGTLPNLNWTGPLISLVLSSTNFSGNIPSAICNLSSLRTLVLSDNAFSGLIPQYLGNLTNLQQLDMSLNNLTGPLLQSLGNLTNLQQLDMSLNHLTGPLPQSLSNCTHLKHLNVSSNMLNDTFPFWLGHLPNLAVLDLGQNSFYGPLGRSLNNFSLTTLILHQNHFSGHLPDLDGHLSLNLLHLSNNSFDGPIPKLPQYLSVLLLSNNNFKGEIPQSICMNFTIILDLSNNNLTGIIPPCLLTYGGVINLGKNKLKGAIPDIFIENTYVGVLDLSDNQLTGPFPQSMINCTELVLLDVSNNTIEDSFPNYLETLPNLQVLVLRSNKFNGKLKTLVDHPFQNLRLFDVSNNNFTEPLPVEYISQLHAMKNESLPLRYLDDYIFENVFNRLSQVNELGKDWIPKIRLTMKGSRFELPKILMALTSIDFSQNNFQGEVPEVVGELAALKGLNLSHNHLIGSIPPSIRNLIDLEWLDLSSNKLNGLIPNGLTHLTGLSILNLSYNDLRGMIPTGGQFDIYPMESFVGNTGLCGSQIAKACDGSNITKLPQRPFPLNEEDDFSAFDWKIVTMGYGCGLVIGISIGYMVFELRRPKWFVLLAEEKLLKKIARSSGWRT